jgi:organic radical activating enzyme
MTTSNQSDFYCSQKFWFLTVDLAKKNQQSCCAARPEKISLQWLKQNPGKLFSTPGLIADRNDMLSGRAVDSCHEACWIPEQRNLVSRRLYTQSNQQTHLDPDIDCPETLNIILGTTCNLTCSYCCKQYSSSWYRDVNHNGPYFDHQRFKITSQEKIIHRLGHTELTQSADYQILLSELKNFKKIKKVKISGGEPFLYNELLDLINQFDAEEIVVFSGLGVNCARFKKQLQLINAADKVRITVSAENLDQFHEFNRYGSSSEQFNRNLQQLIESGIRFSFNSVISNLTVFGLKNFWEKYCDRDITYVFCNDPDWLGVNVLDTDSKNNIINQINQSDIPVRNKLIQVLEVEPTETQKTQFSEYFVEFARRRNLALDIFPGSLLEWTKNNVV